MGSDRTQLGSGAQGALLAAPPEMPFPVPREVAGVLCSRQEHLSEILNTHE